MIGRFIRWNTKLCRGFDGLFPFARTPVTLGRHDPKILFVERTSIADIGGGKKPFSGLRGLDPAGKRYAGMDLDPDELAAAPAGSYSETHVVDLLDPPAALSEQFDFVICRHTLEHVTDTEKAIATLVRLLRPGGVCFIHLPCRKALFARVNLMLPNETKRRIMHRVFPQKSGDGFPAYYDRCTPSQIGALVAANGAEVVAESRRYWSSYFSFFLPLFMIWRMLTALQYAFDRDYCESFSIVFVKHPAPDTPGAARP